VLQSSIQKSPGLYSQVDEPVDCGSPVTALAARAAKLTATTIIVLLFEAKVSSRDVDARAADEGLYCKAYKPLTM